MSVHAKPTGVDLKIIDDPEYCSKGDLMKKGIQKLTVGARIAITKHSITKNSAQLCHDLRNGPSHAFGITQDHFSRVHLSLIMKLMRKINQQPIEYLINAII